MLVRDRKLQGVVRDADAMKLVRKGVTDLSSILSDDFNAVQEDTSLSELFVPSVESPLPLAVVDANGRLVGVVPRVTLLAALGNVTTDTGDIQILEPPLTVPSAVITDALASSDSDSSVKEDAR